jgi:hypothetical protein
MAVRITTTVGDDRTVLKVDGWLKADDVEELSRAYQSMPGPTVLDLSDLHSADRDGAQLLRELLAVGVELCGAAPYMELLLKTKH